MNQRKSAHSIIQKFKDQSILVIGDVLLDRYISGRARRISPEAPVPVVQVSTEKDIPGGAGNVASNIQALGGHALLSGIVGKDEPGRKLMELLAEKGISIEAVMLLNEARTTVKTRILADRQQVVRVDWDNQVSLSDEMLRTYVERLSAAVKGVSGVIIEDYDRGTVGQEVVNAVLSAAQREGVPVGLDPHRNSELSVDGLTLATPNRSEVFALAHLAESPLQSDPLNDKALLKAANILMERWKPTFLIITLGVQGMLLISREHKPEHIPTVAREVFDVSGAGDTVIAATLLAFSAGADYHNAVQLANCAAGVVVGKVGTDTCTGEELSRFLDALVEHE